MNGTTHNDGGPAFPSGGGFDGRDYCGPCFGMTLRDWFAGQALIAVTATGKSVEVAVAGARENNIDPGEYIARIAYQQADAMIAERRAATTKENDL